jgi:hypothetical protein
VAQVNYGNYDLSRESAAQRVVAPAPTHQNKYVLGTILDVLKK